MNKSTAFITFIMIGWSMGTPLRAEEDISLISTNQSRVDVMGKQSVSTNKRSMIKTEFDVGMGYWGGDVTYTIGGNVWDSRYGDDYVRDPLSELKFPLSVYAVNLNGSFVILDRVEVYGRYEKAVNDPDRKVEDSDWNNYGYKTAYSESDCDLDAWSGDAGLRFWVYTHTWKGPGIRLGIAPGIGYRKQSLDWTVGNLKQQDYYYYGPYYLGSETITRDGKVLTYDYEMDMAYLSAKFYLQNRFFLVSFSGGASIYMNTEAVDDHILRYKKCTQDFDGHAVFLELEGRYYVTPHVFLLGRLYGFHSESDGKQKQVFYDGRNEGLRIDIDSRIKSSQGMLSLAFGCSF